jgi:hypothetical protein
LLCLRACRWLHCRLAVTFAAANPAAAFVIGVTAAVVAANIFRDELTQVLGVDIVGAAKTGVNYIIGSFVAAFEDIKFVWANLPNIVGAAAIGATNAVINAVNAMINGAKMQVNSLIAAINQIPGVNIGALDTAGSTISNLENPYADKLAAGVGDRNAAVNGALSKDYLGEFDGAITKGASAASAKLKELAKDLTTVDDKSKKKGGAGGGKTEAEKYSDIVDGANRRIASLKAEQQALGMTEAGCACPQVRDRASQPGAAEGHQPDCRAEGGTDGSCPDNGIHRDRHQTCQRGDGLRQGFDELFSVRP